MTQNSYFIFHIPFPFLRVLNIHLQSKHSDTWKILTKNIIGIFAGQQTATMCGEKILSTLGSTNISGEHCPKMH